MVGWMPILESHQDHSNKPKAASLQSHLLSEVALGRLRFTPFASVFFLLDPYRQGSVLLILLKGPILLLIFSQWNVNSKKDVLLYGSQL